MKIRLTRKSSATVVVMLLVAGTTFGIISSKNTNDGSSAIHSSEKKDQPSTTTPSSSKKQGAQSVVGGQLSKDKTQQTEEPASEACKLFTPNLARQILGNKAKVVVDQSSDVSESKDVLLTSCVYANNLSEAATVKLTAHIAKTELGRSTNAVSFGSGHPADAIAVQGYGQVSYWDGKASVLNVLKNNNWYEISRSDGNPSKPAGLSEVKLVANIVVPKL